jgi:hypothetical protein
MSDQQSATLATTGRARVNGLVTFDIDSPGDQDWFRITLIAGRDYQFDLFGANGGVFTLPDPLLNGIRDAAGSLIPGTRNDDVAPGVNTDSRVVYTPSVSGTYYIDVGAFGANIGSYALSVVDLSVPDVRNNDTTNAILTVGNAGVQGRIGVSGDSDWYRVDLVAGRVYRFEVNGFDSRLGTLGDPSINGIYFGGTLRPFTHDDDGGLGRDARLDFMASATGTHFIDVSAFGGQTGTFRLIARDITPADITGDIFTTATITVNAQPLVGRHDAPFDADWYRVSLTAGVTYRIELLGLATGQGTLLDPYLRSVRDAAGVAIDQTTSDDQGLGTNSLLTFTASTTGLHYLDVAEVFGGVGSYRVSVRTVRNADLPASEATSAAAVINGSVLGRVDSGGDVDWFRAGLVQGRTYRIELAGSDGDGPALFDPVLLGLFRPDGTLLDGTTNDDFGNTLNSQITFTAPGGQLYIAAGGFAAATGDYRLSVTDITIADLGADTRSLGRVVANGQTSSRIGLAEDEDWFRVGLVAGRVYAIEVNSDASSASPLADPQLIGLFDATGAAIANTANDDYGESLNSRAVFVPTATGTYFVGAGAFGSFTGDYIVSVADVTSVVDLEAASTATTRTVAVGGSATGAINSARDEDWFAVTLVGGTAYSIELRGLASGAGTLNDPRIMGIRDSLNRLIPGTPNEDDGGSTDARTVFRPDNGGTFYIAVAGAPSDEGTYRLSVEVTNIGNDVASTPQTTAVAFPDDTAYSGLINVLGDVDWVRVPVVFGTTYEFNLAGATSGNGTLADPVLLGLFDERGRAVSARLTPDVDGKEDRAVMGAEFTGNVFAAVRSGDFGTGSYLLQVDTLVGFDLVGPRLISTSPEDGAGAVGIFSNFTFTFSETVRAGIGDIVVKRAGLSDIVVPTTDPQVRLDGRTMTLDLAAPLPAGLNIRIELEAGAVRDVAGNQSLAVTGAAALDFTTTTSANGRWTIMVYIAGDNDLETFAVKDLNEMEEIAGLQGLGVNVVVLTDRSPGFATDSGNWSDTRFGRIIPDSNTAVAGSLSSIGTSVGELNMGDPANLTTFINNAAALAPADQYALVIWNHGGGLSGAAWDDSSRGDFLSVKEIRDAVDASSITKFDLIGFDACQMAIADMAFAVRELCDVFVGSQMDEPGDGWAYDDILAQLKANPTMTESQLAQAIVTTYGNFYAGQPNITLSALTTSLLDELAVALNNFVAVALASPLLSDRVFLSTSQNTALRFPNVDGSAADLVDYMEEVMRFCSGPAIDAAAAAVIDAVRDAVFATTGSVPDAEGLSINLPRGATQPDYTATNYSFLANDVPLWRSFLDLF